MKGKKERKKERKKNKKERGGKKNDLGIVKNVPSMYPLPIPLHIAGVAPVVKTGSVKGTDERGEKKKEREREGDDEVTG